MTDAELDELISNCPTLYHMAERGSWPAIERYGLLSTSALMDLYEIDGAQRAQIELAHRPKSVSIAADGLPGAVIRDQIPMSDSGLKRALPSRLQPSDWYALLNSKVFFWLSVERLHKLTQAGAYRDHEHDVLEVDTRLLVDAHRDKIWLCPINSGCTKPMPHPRDEGIFSRIPQYPYAHWRSRRGRTERAVELAIDYSVPDIARYVRRVVVKRGSEVMSIIE
ncbi:DUF7002 family protein [Novosphingobium mathurense]|uniref:Uncharacterized protein n=1 Tax=Novosphingobium mathurense TaxID=428990 RepID=A0A1U6I9K1_9SPHN|nr:hypothetical protein [Novosphingobium mathurense]SLK04704.1 hypothetical protein SAMN06295987_1053 [Novosphingobium mathurense]